MNEWELFPTAKAGGAAPTAAFPFTVAVQAVEPAPQAPLATEDPSQAASLDAHVEWPQ